jgi:hypothetical protein
MRHEYPLRYQAAIPEIKANLGNHDAGFPPGDNFDFCATVDFDESREAYKQGVRDARGPSEGHHRHDQAHPEGALRHPVRARAISD